MTVALAEPSDTIRAAVQQVTAIATLPEVTARIVATVEDPRSSAAQLHQIVSHDPALVARILKVVNSAFYGLPGQIASIDRAIVLLGLNAVKNIAVAASLGQLFQGTRLCTGYAPRDIWQHCIAVAVAARELARELKLPIVEEAFLAGMIHDIGLLVALQVWPEKLQQVCERALSDESDFCAIERDLNGGIDHQQLGQAMVEHWKFPRACQQVAGYHHRPEELPADSRLLSAVLYVADTLCAQQEAGFPLTARHQQIAGRDLDPLRIDQLILDRLAAILPDKIQSATQLLC